MCRRLVVATTVMALCGSQAAVAGSQGYIVSNWVPAMNNFDDSGCPQGRNAGAHDIMTYTLKEQGVPEDQIAKLTDPTTLNNRSFGKYTGMRGKEDGKPVNIYTHPLSAPDPHIKLDQAKEGFGFNLDGKDGPLNYTDPLTKETGVDNAAARVFGCFDRTRGTRELPPLTLRWVHYVEGNSWLIEVTNNSSKPLNFQNEDNVTVKFYRGLQPPLISGSGYQRNVTYTIDPDPRLKTLTSFKGKIKDGVFIADATPEFRMIASPRMSPVFDFKSAHMRMTFNHDGTIEAFVGGYLPIEAVYFPFGNYGAEEEYIGGIDVSGLYYALQQNADTDIDRDKKTGKRTRISQTYLAEGTPAYLTRVGNAK